MKYIVASKGAYHLIENFGNSGGKVNGKVTFRKFQPKIEKFVLSSPLIPVQVRTKGNVAVTIYEFFGSFSVPDSRYTNSPHFWFQTITDVAILWYTLKSLTIMLSTPQPDFSVKW